MEDLCWLCKKHEVWSKTRPLCRGCYGKCHKNHILDLVPQIHRKRVKIISIQDKYGDAMFKDMALLNAGETTLNEIGTKYGLTREAIRLIYNKVFDEKYTVTVKRRVAKNKEDRKRAVEEWNKWGNRIKRASESGKNKHGFKTEVIFEEKCRSLNYDVVMHGAMAPIDSTVNGFLVDVKTGTLTEVTPGEFYFRFNVSKAQAIGVDFFAAYIKKDDAWYIIPNDKTKSKKYTAYITPKFRQYLNTWDQLELSNSFPQSKNSS